MLSKLVGSGISRIGPPKYLAFDGRIRRSTFLKYVPLPHWACAHVMDLMSPELTQVILIGFHVKASVIIISYSMGVTRPSLLARGA
jgi:hypothetical protein